MLTAIRSTLARYGIRPTLVDDRADKTTTGRADGLQPKTIETFRQLGLADDLLRKGVKIYDICFWNSTALQTLRRMRRVEHYPNSLDVLDPFILLVHQGMVEDVFLKDMAQRGVHVLRSLTCTGFTKSSKHLTVEVQSQGIEQNTKTLKTQYLVGCDGAHSKVRKAISGAVMEGEPSRAVWGVLDGVVETDFPDLWSKVVIHSEARGTILCIPREQNMTRLYIEVKSSLDVSVPETRQVTQEYVMQRAREIIAPYTLNWSSVEWFSNYKVGQRVASTFVDSTELPAVFIAGDAGHTHSPKAAQGMNTSMHDTFNLSWKLNLAIRKLARSSLLQTYQDERRKIAVDLITFDFEHAAAFEDGDDNALAENFCKNTDFISGIGARYDVNCLNEAIIDGSLRSSNLRPGSLLTPGQATRYIDANPIQLTLDIPLSSQFRIYFVVGDIQPSLAFLSLVSAAALDPNSFFGRLSRRAEMSYTRDYPVSLSEADSFTQSQRYMAVSKLFTYALITTAQKSSFEVEQLPDTFNKSRWTVYLDNIRSHKQSAGVIQKWLGRQLMCDEVVVLNVRPDGYVGSLRSWTSTQGEEAVSWLGDYYNCFLQA